jgi:hypothetical protein
MKSVSFALGMLLLSTSSFAATESVSTTAARDYNVIVSPLGFLVGTAKVGFEFGMSVLCVGSCGLLSQPQHHRGNHHFFSH